MENSKSMILKYPELDTHSSNLLILKPGNFELARDQILSLILIITNSKQNDFEFEQESIYLNIKECLNDLVEFIPICIDALNLDEKV